MAQRIGKYKVSKRESALSLIDGGTITSGKLIITDLATVTAGGDVAGLAAGTLFTTGSIPAADIGGITGSAKVVLCKV